MDWLKKNFDRAALVAVGLIALAGAAFIVLKTTSFADEFEGRNSGVRPDNNVPPPAIEVVKKRIEMIVKPTEWGTHSGSLFVSEPYLIKDGANPVNPLAAGEPPLHPPIANEWIKKYNLDFADANLPNADPDGDKFSNIEEFNGKTDPISAQSKPGFITKLRLETIIRTPFRLKFSGKPEPGIFEINTRDLKSPTQFLKLGDQIPNSPYKITNYEEKFIDRNGLQLDDSSLILLNTESGEKITLNVGKEADYPLLSGRFKNLFNGDVFEVKKNDSFSVKPDATVKYKLIDISDTEAVIESPQGDKITVPRVDS